MMIGETGKRRRSRIELGYYRAPDALSRWRTRLCLIALLAAAGWLAAATFAGRNIVSHAWLLEPRRLASKGPLARPHAIWDSTCEACHIPFAPINGSRWAPTRWTGSPAGREKCTMCHAGPVHHLNQRQEDIPACAECHRDHRGRDVSLLTMDASACTACHHNLAEHRDQAGSPLKVAGNVTHFDREHHPDFSGSSDSAYDPADPEIRVKFNHALHLAAGLTLEQGGNTFTFAQLPALDRVRYGWKETNRQDLPVQLACASCHQADVDDDLPTCSFGSAAQVMSVFSDASERLHVADRVRESLRRVSPAAVRRDIA